MVKTKRKFTFKRWSGASDAVEADTVSFVHGYVAFYDEISVDDDDESSAIVGMPGKWPREEPETHYFLVRAVETSNCLDLREVRG